MLRRASLYVHSVIGSVGADEVVAARARAYGGVDPLLRGFVRRRVMARISPMVISAIHGEDTPHLHRVSLLTLQRIEHDEGDKEAVRAAFDGALGEAGPARFSTIGVRFGGRILALALVLLAAGLGLGYRMWPEGGLRAELPPSRGAYEHGGRPDPGDARVRGLFEAGIPRFVVALDRYRATRGDPLEPSARQRLDEELQALLGEGEAALGADSASFLRAVLEQAVALVAADQPMDEAADGHIRSVDAFNAALASRGLGYYLDAEVMTDLGTGRHRVYFSTFSVERVSLYRSGERRVRALRLSRLDRLNFARAVLGFTRPHIRDALVLGERVETHMVQLVLPSLAPDARVELVDPESGLEEEAWAQEVARRAAEDMRAEAGVAAGDEGRAAELGRLVGRRTDLVMRWNGSGRLRAGLRIRLPERYEWDPSTLERIQPLVPREEWRELEEIHARLDEEQMRATYLAIEEALLRSVERHESQHRLDYLGGHLASLPDSLEAITGPLEAGGIENPRAQRALAELSAYLSELARGPEVVRTNLAGFVRYLLDRRQWGRPECYAALVVFEALADELEVEHGPLLARRQIRREEAAAIYLALRAKPTAELTEASTRLWARLFGRPFPELRPSP